MNREDFKYKKRKCIDCGVLISSNGGKKRCDSCSVTHAEEMRKQRRSVILEKRYKI